MGQAVGERWRRPEVDARNYGAQKPLVRTCFGSVPEHGMKPRFYESLWDEAIVLLKPLRENREFFMLKKYKERVFIDP